MGVILTDETIQARIDDHPAEDSTVLADHVKNQRPMRIVPPRFSVPDDEAMDRVYAEAKDKP